MTQVSRSGVSLARYPTSSHAKSVRRSQLRLYASFVSTRSAISRRNSAAARFRPRRSSPSPVTTVKQSLVATPVTTHSHGCRDHQGDDHDDHGQREADDDEREDDGRELQATEQRVGGHRLSISTATTCVGSK